MKKVQQKHILLVRSGYPAKEFVLKRLKELGYYVVILDTEKSCPDNLMDEWILADLNNYTETVAQIQTYIDTPGNYLDGALTFWEEAVILTAKITDTFGWAGNPFETVSKIKNKLTFREVCRANNLPTPRHHTIKNKEDLFEIPHCLNFPVVIKPIYGACSAFVVKANTIEELEKAYDGIQHYINLFWLAPEWENKEVYVEEYIEGEEVDIDILLQNGQVKFYSISDNFQTNEPYFIETGQAIPSRLEAPRQDSLIQMASHVLKTLGITDGCVHFEAKSSPLGPVPIEINLRMGGDEVYSFVKYAWNVDLVENAAAIATREPISIRKLAKPLVHLEGRYLLPEVEGTLQSIDIDRSIHRNRHLFELRLSKKVNDRIQIPPHDFDYFGWITATGKDAKSARENVEQLHPLVKFKVTPQKTQRLQRYF